MATTIKHRRDTAAAWAASDLVLAQGEIGFEYDTGRFKIGDGVTPWDQVNYASPSPDKDLDVSGVWKFGGRPLVSTAATTYYIDQVNGNDANAGTTAAAAFKTWGKVASLIPRFLNHHLTIRIVGNYDNLNGYLVVENLLVGSYNFTIMGDTGARANHVINGGLAMYSTIAGVVEGIHVKNLTFERANMPFDFRSAMAYVYDCAARRPASTALVSGSQGVLATNSPSVRISACDLGIDQYSYAIQAYNNARVLSTDNSGRGAGYGLLANLGSVIGKTGAQPTGVTANESMSAGGVIR